MTKAPWGSGWGKGVPRHKFTGAAKSLAALNRKPWICEGCGAALTEQQMRGNNPVEAICSCIARCHPRRIFHGDLCDIFDAEAPVEWLAEWMDGIRQADQCEHIICTKRPELWGGRVETVLKWLEAADCKWPASGYSSLPLRNWMADWFVLRRAPANLTVLTSVESQEQDRRIDDLLRIPAARRGLSMEPLLGLIDMDQRNMDDIDWIIIGGESGPKARPCNVEWIRSLVRQCEAAGVPVFVKQLGSNPNFEVETEPGVKTHVLDHLDIHHPKGGDPAEWPEDLQRQQFPFFK